MTRDPELRLTCGILGLALAVLAQPQTDLPTPDSPERVRTLLRDGLLAATQGRPEDALQLLEEKWRTDQAGLGATHRETLGSLRILTDHAGCLGDWSGCVRHSRSLLSVSDFDELVARGCAAAALLAGDERTYREVCERMVAERGATSDAIQAERVAKVCLLAPGGLVDLRPALRLAEQAVKSREDDPWFRLVQGLAELRSNRAREALRWLEPVRSSPELHARTMAGYTASLAHHQLDAAEPAREALTTANALLDAFLQRGRLAEPGWDSWWFDPAASIILRREAERAVLGREVSPLPSIASLGSARRTWWLGWTRLGCEYPAERLLAGAWKASWSPDGKQLAFARQEGGIGVMELESRQVTDLVARGKDPAWSPDGKFIAYVTADGEDYQSEEVWIIPAAGGAAVRIGQGGFPSWSADSTEVRFHSRSEGQILSARVSAPEEPPALYYAKPLSWYPAISPDSSRLAFGTPGALVIVDRDSGRTVTSLETPDERGFLPAWSPDGRQVAFGGFAGSRAGLWIFDVQRGGAFRVARGPDCTMPAWSPDGGRLAFDFRGATQEVWVVNTRSLPLLPALTNRLPARVVPGPALRVPPVAALVGQPVPGAFQLPLLEGGELAVRDPRMTNILLLDFWASWCGPCRQIMPVLEEVAREYASQGLRYVAVNLREEPDAIRRYLATAGVAPTVALDAEGRMALAFRVRAIPTMVLVDRKGVVAWAHEGATPDLKPRLIEAVRGLLDRDRCLENLKVLGLASQLWAVDHGNVMPPDLQSMSKEVSSTQVLVCPADTGRRAATDWGTLTTDNVSYEFLAPSVPVPESPGRRQRVVFRCPVHDNVVPLDGAVRARPSPGAPDQLLREDGVLYFGPPGVPADGVGVPEQRGQ